MLLDYIKRQLGYTWADDTQNAILEDLQEEAIAYLSLYTTADPAQDVLVRGLVVEYIRYTLANAKDDFAKNYSKELLALENRERKKAYAENLD